MAEAEKNPAIKIKMDMKQVTKIQYYLTACPNDAMQYAVLAAIEQASDYPDVLAKEFQARCDLITDRLRI